MSTKGKFNHFTGGRGGARGGKTLLFYTIALCFSSTGRGRGTPRGGRGGGFRGGSGGGGFRGGGGGFRGKCFVLSTAVANALLAGRGSRGGGRF